MRLPGKTCLVQLENRMSRRRALPHDDSGAGADVPELLSTPTWPPSAYQPLEPPPRRPRYAGILLLAMLAAVVGAAAYLLRETPPPADVDDAELNRLIADKRAELSRAENAAPVESSEAAGATSLLYVDSNPSGAVVLLDADTVGITPLDGRTVKTGVYVLSIRKEDYAPHDTVVFILEEDAVPRLFVDLAPAGAYVRDEALIASTRSPSPDLSRSPATTLSERAEQSASPPARRQTESARNRQSEPARSGSGSAPDRSGERSVRTAATQDSATPESPENQTANEPSPPLTGLVTVLVRPWGTIYIDGHLEKLNTDVQHTAALPVGRHVVRVEHPALGAREQVVEIRNGQPRHVLFDLLASDPAEGASGTGSSGDDGS